MIKIAKPKDLDELTNLRKIFCHEDLHAFNSSTTKKLFKEIISNKKIGTIFVYKLNNIIIGYAFIVHTYSLEFNGHDALLDELFILPKFRGKGRGMELISYALKYTKKMNQSYLHLEVMHSNKRVLKFYKRLGFKIRKSQHLILPLKKHLNYPVCF